MGAQSRFQGTYLGEWGAQNTSLSETRYGSRHRTALHAHGGATVAFVLSGGFSERQGGRSFECGPGTVIVRPGGLEHDDTFARDGGRTFNIEMPDDLVAGVTLPAIHRDGGAPTWIAQRIVGHIRDADPLSTEATIAELVEMMCPPPRAQPRAQLRRVEALLRATHCATPSLAELARVAGVHPMHLARLWRQSFGESVGTTARRLRVEAVARALAATPRPLAEVAQTAGFADQAHMTRVFRRLTGVTPARFRNVFRPGASIVQDGRRRLRASSRR